MISYEDIEQAQVAYDAHGTLRATAEALGWSMGRVQRALAKGVREGGPTYLKSMSSGPHGTSRHYVIPPGQPMELMDGERVTGRSILSGPDGVKIWWDKTKVEQHEADLKQALVEVFSEIRGSVVDIGGAPAVSHDALLQYYPLADQHVGLLAWGKETGEEDYDLRIAEQRMRDVTEQLVVSAPAARHALIAGLGDYYHVDDQNFATPSSKHRLDGDGRHYKILKTGVRMQKDFINLALQRHEHVTVINLPGNHDPHAKMVLDIALSEAYVDHPRVTIIDTPSRWYFHQFGDNLIGQTHGDECKPAIMVLRMAEHPQWSACRHRQFYYGHFHRDQSDTHGSCRTICVPTLTSRDAWGAGKGFTSPKALVGITFHAQDGEIASQRVNV
jgi:hypothetical protein